MVLAARNRVGVAIALLGSLAMLTFGPVPAYAAATAPTVTLTGQLIQLADQTGPPAAAVRTADRQLVPVAASVVKNLKPGSAVTLNVVVPAAVRSVAAANRTLTVRGPNGRTTSTPLDAQDLAAASDGTPEPGTSDLGRATVASAVSTGQALAVSAVVLAADPVGSFTPATRHLFVAVVTPKGWPTPNAVTQVQIQTQVDAASNYWSAVSGGAVTLDVATISATYTSAYNCTNPLGMLTEAANNTVFPDTPNTSLVVELPPGISNDATSNCSYGLGTIGANVNDSGMLYVSDDAFPVLAHELGHNMSLRHADTLQCPSASDSPFDGTNWTGGGCTETSYGDGDDVMSASRPDFAPFLSSPQSLRTGLIPVSAATVISSNSASTVILNALGSRVGVRTAQVEDPTNGVTYYVEYRVAATPDTGNVYGDAVGVRVLRFNPVDGATVLLDPTPTGTTSDTDATLHGGSTFTSYSGAVRVTTVSSTPTTATVTITSGVGAPTAPLVAITGKPAALTASATASFSFAGFDTTDAASSLRYLCSRDGATASACTSPVTYTALTSAVHTFTVKVLNLTGNSASATSSWRVDRVAPTLTMTAPTTVYALTTGLVPAWSAKDVGGGLANVDVRWARAAYNGGFTTAVYPSTWQKSTATKTTLSGAAPGYTYCFSARARDKAGNLSAWSAPRCSAVALDDRSLTASAGWARSTSSVFYRSTATVSSRSAVTLTRTRVQTRRIYLVATRCRTCGTVGVYWNGALIKKVSLYASTTTRRSVIGITTFTGVRAGTLTIRTLTRNRAVQIDGVALVRG